MCAKIEQLRNSVSGAMITTIVDRLLFIVKIAEQYAKARLKIRTVKSVDFSAAQIVLTDTHVGTIQQNIVESLIHHFSLSIHHITIVDILLYDVFLVIFSLLLLARFVIMVPGSQ